MKTDMQIKTSDRFHDQEKAEFEPVLKNTEKGGARNRFALCAALILLLGVSGYAGTIQQDEATPAAAPVSIRTLAENDYEEMTFESARERLKGEREWEKEMLNGILADPQADPQTKKNAQNQLLLLARRMDMESQIETALAQMGCEQAKAVYAEERTILIVPAQYADEQNENIRLIDAIAAITGGEEKDVKIILVKK